MLPFPILSTALFGGMEAVFYQNYLHQFIPTPILKVAAAVEVGMLVLARMAGIILIKIHYLCYL